MLRPRLRVLVPLVLLLLVGGAVAWKLAVREKATPVSVKEAISRFRAQSARARAAAAGALRGRVPEPGTYVYATRGFEEAHALGTRRHHYPARTTVTVLREGCGVVERWDPLQTRAEKLELCPSPGRWRQRSFGDVHRFVGRLDRRTYACTPASTYLPARRSPGTSWTTRCAINGTLRVEHSTVVGERTLAIAGRPVRTLLLRLHLRISGKTKGAGTTSLWVEPRTGLLVRRVTNDASRTNVIITTVPYREHIEMTLVSLRPRR